MSGLRGTLSRVVTSVGAGLGCLQTYGLPFAWNQGPQARWWEPLRRGVSRALGRFYDERAGPREITAGEYAGQLALSLEEAERLLWEQGFVRSPLSRLKTRDGDPEFGSWVYRDAPLARRQLHVMLFEGGGGIDVYAHEEPSSVNPFVGAAHFDGEGQRVALGVELARERLPIDASDATADPPEGHWSDGPT
jgi:hypothetical protein